MPVHLAIRVAGRVQRVFYRHSAARKAQELGLVGFVRNEPDGTVYIEAEGNEAALGEFIKWCHQGPPLARVDHVEISPGPAKSYDSFTIQRA